MAQEGKEIDRVPLELALEHFGSHDILAKDAFGKDAQYASSHDLLSSSRKFP